MKTRTRIQKASENTRKPRNIDTTTERRVGRKTYFLSYKQVLVGSSPDQPVAGDRKLAPLSDAPQGTTAGPSLTGSVPGTGLLVAQRQVRARVASP